MIQRMSRQTRRRVRTALLERDPHCIWCGYEFPGMGQLNHSTPTFPTIEHIWPLSHGGTDDIDNLALACKRCNK